MSLASFPTSSFNDCQLDTQLYTMVEREGNRYRAFFAKLTGKDGPLVSRDTALAFFRKSSLSEKQVQELYARIKGQKLLREWDHMQETEFVLAMHFIVCITKRHLVQIPPEFPTYLFPTLNLTAESVPTQVSQTSSDAPMSFAATSLVDATSLSDLMTRELHSKQHEVQALSRVDQSDARALQNLHVYVERIADQVDKFGFPVYVERIADQVDKFGFPVPDSMRSLKELDGLKTLLQKHVLAAKQEIQSLQIDAQMRSVASKTTHDSKSRADPLKTVSGLTQELLTLQHQTAELMAKKVDVVGRLVAVTTGRSVVESIIQKPSGGSAFTEPKNPALALSKGALTVGELVTSSALTRSPKTSDPAVVQSHSSASSGGWGTFEAATSQNSPPPQLFGAKNDKQPVSSDPFGFGSLPAASRCC